MSDKDVKDFIDYTYGNMEYSELYKLFKPLVESGAIKESLLVSYLKRRAIGNLVFKYDTQKWNYFTQEYSDSECIMDSFFCKCGGQWDDSSLDNDCYCDKCEASMMESIDQSLNNERS